MFKKLGSLALAAIVLVSLAACSDLQDTKAEGIYVSIDINPSVEFIINEEDIVESYNLLNEDAQILCADVDFIGMTIEDASELFIQLATEAGFIDVDSEDNAILITVIGEDDSELILEIQERIRTRANAFMARNNISAEIFTEDFTNEDLIAQAEELGISPGKLRLILVAQIYDPELTLEDGINTPIKDLVQNVKTAHKAEIANMTAEEKAAFIQQKTQLMTQFRARLQEHIAANPTTTTGSAISVRTTTRTRWQAAADAWQERMENRKDNTGNGNNE